MANRLKMRILLLLSLVYINCDYLQAQTTIPRFEEGERVVFVGNSITHGGHYHSFIYHECRNWWRECVGYEGSFGL